MNIVLYMYMSQSPVLIILAPTSNTSCLKVSMAGLMESFSGFIVVLVVPEAAYDFDTSQTESLVPNPCSFQSPYVSRVFKGLDAEANQSWPSDKLYKSYKIPRRSCKPRYPTYRSLEEATPRTSRQDSKFLEEGSSFKIFPLHSMVPREEQDVESNVAFAMEGENLAEATGES